MDDIDPLVTLEEIMATRSGFDTRPDIGPATGLVARMLRFYGGNPIKDFTDTSTGVANIRALPNVPVARSCVVQVIAGSIVFTDGGGTPANGTSMTVGTGTLVTLLGQETILGWQWASTGTVNATIAAIFYD